MVHVVAMSSTEEMSNIVSLVECNVSQASPCDIWHLDSSCNNHMTRNIELFSSLDDSVPDQGYTWNRYPSYCLRQRQYKYFNQTRRRESYV
jgi:hypothetical protein